MFRSPSSPTVTVLETPLGASPELAESFLLQWAFSQAAGTGLLAGPRPRRVLVVDLCQPREAQQKIVQATGHLLRIESPDDLPLRLLGQPKGSLWHPLLGRLDAVRLDFAPDLIVIAGAEHVPGTGFDWQGRDAWGISGPWGPGRDLGPLGWQRTYAKEWAVRFVNHFTARPGTPYAVDSKAFKRSADFVVTLQPERRSEPSGRHRLTNDDGQSLLVRRTRAGLWALVEAPDIAR